MPTPTACGTSWACCSPALAASCWAAARCVEGNTDSAIAVLGLAIGAAFAHNFGLASSAAGPTANGKVAVIIGIVVVAVIAVANTVQKKQA